MKTSLFGMVLTLESPTLKITPKNTTEINETLDQISSVVDMQRWSKETNEVIAQGVYDEFHQLHLSKEFYKEIQIIHYNGDPFSQFASEGEITATENFILLDLANAVIRNRYGFDTLLTLYPSKSRLKTNYSLDVKDKTYSKEWIDVSLEPRYFIANFTQKELHLINVLKQEEFYLLPTKIENSNIIFSLEQ